MEDGFLISYPLNRNSFNFYKSVEYSIPPAISSDHLLYFLHQGLSMKATAFSSTDAKNALKFTEDIIKQTGPRLTGDPSNALGVSLIKAKFDPICDEVQNMCRKKLIPERPKVVNVGAVGCIIEKLKNKNMLVTATDLDENIINKELCGVNIADGALHTDELVAEADLAIITGMTISNGSLPEIIKTAKENNTKIMIVAETGAGFGRAYCDLFDIDIVVSEPYPFYIFNCYSQILIYRKEN